MTNSINEILQTKVILCVGSNTTEAHPVTGYRIKQAVKDGAKLIVVDPRKIELVRYADLWLRIRPGTNVALLNGLAHVILRDDLWNKQFVEERGEGFEEWRQGLEQYTPEYVANICGIKPELIEEAAQLYSMAEKATIVYAMGITQHTSGTNNVFAIANLAMVTGQVGREGTGVAPLRGQNNVQGSCDMGALPNYYPSYRFVDDSGARQELERAWGVGPEASAPGQSNGQAPGDSLVERGLPAGDEVSVGIGLPVEPGLTVTEIMKAAERGKIKAMYIMGENPVLSDPDANHVVEALKKLDFLMVQDIFLTETAQLAEVVLPAASFAEKEGTFTNTERRVQRVRKAIEPPGEAKPDWLILVELANHLGKPWHYPRGPEEIMEEIAWVTPIYGGISYPRLEETGLQWPCPHPDHPGTPWLHCEKFACGKGRFHRVEHHPPAEEPDQEYPLLLTTGRMLYQFHTGTMSRRSRLEDIHSHELAMLNPDDAAFYGICDGDRVQVESRRGKVQTMVQVTDHVPPGIIFMTFHFKETATNLLTNSAADPICKIPELKACAVRLLKFPV
jgi:predicted molibdopterin-dependent oxidoreductase YjgC